MDTKVNARTLPPEALPFPLRPFMPDAAFMFTWEGSCVDSAIGADSVEAMQFCHDHGFIDHTTKLLYGQTLRAWCEKKAPECAKLLKRLGYPDESAQGDVSK